MPEELDQLTRKALQLEIEIKALQKETDDASKERLKLSFLHLILLILFLP